jgi:LysR family nitrogen assimilation transcriptional regulator
MLDFSSLQSFLRVAELGSINRAAASLHTSQPSLSRHIAQLEHAVGSALFTRSRSGVKLTEAGETLLARAQPILDQISRLREDIGQGASGSVALGFPPSLQHLVSAPIVEHLVRSHPGISVQVHEAINNVLRQMMLDGQVDLCIAALDVGGLEGYSAKALVTEPLLLVGDTDAGLEADRPIALSRLRHTQLILPSRPNYVRMMVEDSLRRANHPLPRIMGVDTISLCLELTRRGLGYTVMPFAALAGPLGKGVVWAPIRGLSVTWSLFENERRSRFGAVRLARKTALDVVESLLADGLWPHASRQ